MQTDPYNLHSAPSEKKLVVLSVTDVICRTLLTLMDKELGWGQSRTIGRLANSQRVEWETEGGNTQINRDKQVQGHSGQQMNMKHSHVHWIFLSSQTFFASDSLN